MQNPVVWFELYVDDMPRARAFYETVFGHALAPLANPDPDEPLEMWSFPMDMAAPGAGGALAKMPGVRPAAGGALVYFACDDCAVEAGRVAAAGGRLLREKMSIGEHGFIALAQDTEGNTIGLYSMR